jgi:hypothetical protein
VFWAKKSLADQLSPDSSLGPLVPLRQLRYSLAAAQFIGCDLTIPEVRFRRVKESLLGNFTGSFGPHSLPLDRWQRAPSCAAIAAHSLGANGRTHTQLSTNGLLVVVRAILLKLPTASEASRCG